MGLIFPRFDTDPKEIITNASLASAAAALIVLGGKSSETNVGAMGAEITLIDTVSGGTTDDVLSVVIQSLYDGATSGAVVYTFTYTPTAGETSYQSFLIGSILPTRDNIAATPEWIPAMGFGCRIAVTKAGGNRTHSLDVKRRYFNVVNAAG